MAVVSKLSVDEFLARPLRRFESIKKISRERLIERFGLDELTFETESLLHQLAGVTILVREKKFILIFDMGLGKTKTILDMVTNLNPRPRTLVVVPGVVHITQWAEQTKEHAPQLKALPLHGGTEERLQALDENEDTNVEVITYAGLIRLCTSKDPKKKKLALDEKKVKWLARRYDCLVFDECTALKNIHSLPHKIARKMATLVDRVYGLTGTPSGRNIEDVWGQFRVVDGGEALGRTLGIFRAAYFEEKRGFGGWLEYKLREGALEEIKRAMQHSSITYATDECVDLPPQNFIDVHVELTDSQKLDYLEIKAEAQHNRQILLASFTRLRQVCSGVEPYIASNNPKLDALMDLIKEVGGEKVVIFHDFVESGKVISQRLKDAKLKHSRVWGEVKDRDEQLRRFRDDEKYQFLIANSASCAFGLNLQHATRVFYFESPVAVITRQQSEKRCHRLGQDKPTWYYDLVCKDSVEERIRYFIKQGRDITEVLMKGEEKL